MRLRPYTTVLPKPLMPIGDRPILQVVLEKLRDAEVERVTLCVGYLAELIRAFFGEGERLGLRIDYAFEDKPLGTIGPLAFVDGLGEDFLVMNGDILTDLDPRELVREHLACGADLTIATAEREQQVDFGVIEADAGTGSVRGFVEKPRERFEVSMGMYAMNRRVLDTFRAGDAFGFDDLVLALLRAGRPVHRLLHRGEWLDIGRVDDYTAAQDDPRWGLAQ